LAKLTRNGKSILKFGLANNVSTRNKTWNLTDGTTYEMLAVWQGPVKLTMVKIEKAIQKQFEDASKRVPREVATKYMGSGYTECFTVRSKTALMKAVDAHQFARVE